MKIIITENFKKANSQKIIKECQSSSITDVLLRFWPNSNILSLLNHVDKDAVKILYNIWKNEKNIINANAYKRPIDVTSEQIEKMKKAKLIDNIGDKIKITTTGTEELKKMILGDDTNSFEMKK